MLIAPCGMINLEIKPMTEATEKTERSREPQGRNEAVVIFPTHHDWIRKDVGLPGEGLRVLTYSPMYKGVDNSMLYRMMDAAFVRISTDVKFWKVH